MLFYFIKIYHFYMLLLSCALRIGFAPLFAKNVAACRACNVAELTRQIFDAKNMMVAW